MTGIKSYLPPAENIYWFLRGAFSIRTNESPETLVFKLRKPKPDPQFLFDVVFNAHMMQPGEQEYFLSFDNVAQALSFVMAWEDWVLLAAQALLAQAPDIARKVLEMGPEEWIAQYKDKIGATFVTSISEWGHEALEDVLLQASDIAMERTNKTVAVYVDMDAIFLEISEDEDE